VAIIAPETLELIRSRLDIAELVGECVQLTRAGRNMKGRCPFHQERTPSFIVSPERQTFHCFGCGEGGDAFSFVMKTENLSFTEAAEKLAARVGVKVEAQKELGPQDRERLRMKEALEFASGYYHEVLLKDPSADAARKYVASRHLNKAAVTEFVLGYAPRQGHLVEAARKKGFEEEILLKAGLAAKRPDGSLRDYFFDRLMFPIRDAKGATIGFGGRTLGDGEPKYLNSPESPVFSKGRVLYGLFEGSAAVRKARRGHLMEGYMDVIASHQHGLKTACAPLGTALTPEHVVLLKRYVDSAVIVFDADAAGQSAAVRGAEVALAAGLGVRVASVPEGKDPDEFLHAKGLAGFQAALEKAVDLVAFKTELLIARAGELTPEVKSRIAKDVLGTITQCPDEILKDEWVRRLASRLGVNEDSLRRAGGKLIPQSRRSAAAPAASAAPAQVRTAAAPVSVELPSIERSLLEVLAQAPQVLDETDEKDFGSKAATELVRTMKQAIPYDKGWGSRLLNLLEGSALRPLANAIIHKDMPEDDYVRIAREKLKSRRVDLQRKKLSAASGDARQMAKIVADMNLQSKPKA
jgi:DNA primase